MYKYTLSIACCILLTFFAGEAFSEQIQALQWHEVAYTGNDLYKRNLRRDSVINQQLDVLENDKKLETYYYEQERKRNPPAREREPQPNYTYGKAGGTLGFNPKALKGVTAPKTLPTEKTKNASNKNFEIGLETSFLRYKELNRAEQDGYSYGIYGIYTLRKSNNEDIKTWRDIGKGDNMPNFFRFDGRFAWSSLDLVNQTQGSLNDISNYLLEGRAVGGYDIPILKEFLLTPYFGLGYRYLEDDREGRLSGGGVAAERTVHYFYSPMGLDFQKDLTRKWYAVMNWEYDLLIKGREKTHLQDIDENFADVTNGLTKGFGLQGSLKFVKKNYDYNFILQPYIRYWNIAGSEASPIIFNNAPFFGQTASDPENITTEYGLRVGAQF